MKTVLKSAALLLGYFTFANVASAADAYVDPGYNWTGFYAGVDAGFRDLNADVSLPALALSDASPSLNDFSLGGELGYRHQLDNNVVLGISAEAAWLQGDHDADQLTGFPAAFWNAHSDWSASVQGSLGYAFDRAMIYGMGGVAFTDISGCGTIGVAGPCSINTQFSGTHTGWTVGAGLAYALTDNWSTNIEYHYANYGSETYTTIGSVGGVTKVDLDSHAVTAGIQYRF